MKSTREQLIARRDRLAKELAQVREELDKFDTEIYKGKFLKAIKLLNEYYTNYSNYPVIELFCDECRSDMEFGLGEVLDGLEKLFKEEFGEND